MENYEDYIPCVNRYFFLSSFFTYSLTSGFDIWEEEYLAESGDAEEDLALLQDIPSLPRLPWKLPLKEPDRGPGDAGEADIGDLDLTESALDLERKKKTTMVSVFILRT